MDGWERRMRVVFLYCAYGIAELGQFLFVLKMGKSCCVSSMAVAAGNFKNNHALAFHQTANSGRLRHVQVSWTGDFGFCHFRSS